MGYNKDLISPSHLHSTNYTTPHTLAHCNINDITRNDETEWKEKDKDTQYPRWNPTPEQMMLLEEVYNKGTRTPTTEQIQEIASMLQKYGRIQGKNVFYWFQNHKSRERLKRRRPDHQQGFVSHVEPLRKDSSAASRKRGDHRVIHTRTCLSSSSPTNAPQNNNIDDGKRGLLVEEKEATCQNQTKPINTTCSDVNYNLIITSKTSQETEQQYNFNEEEETRKNRTLDLFPVKENQEKTGFAEKCPKQNQMYCNYYYYYEFMPLIN